MALLQMFHRFSQRLIFTVLAGVLVLTAVQATAGEITVFAAASMKNAMDAVSEEWTKATGHRALVSFAGSSALARQIQQGAPADVFISANTDWMDRLQADGLIAPETRFDLLGNALVLIAHGADAPAVEITPAFDLAALLGDAHLAMALVDAVPAGIYGKAALTRLGLWDGVADQVAQGDNVRAALAFVSTGEAPFGIVYATDAAADQRVSVIGTFPADSHPPIIYPAAGIKDSTNPLTESFLIFLRSPQAQAAFQAQGFVFLGK